MTTTINYKQHTYAIECDMCNDIHEDDGVWDGDDVRIAWKQAERLGWKAEKVGKEWMHTCPKCAPTAEKK